MTSPPLVKNKYRFFAVAALGTFMATLDGSILNVALPTISADLGVSVDLVSWVVLSYTLTLISLMLVFGALTQRKGYKFSYRFGFGFFLVGSLACALAGNIYLLIGGRIVQAIGTAMFVAVGPAMITTVFPAKERGKGIGLMVMMVSAGFMTGPPLGGLMLGIWSWHSIFYINLPIGIIGLLLVQRYFGSIPITTGGRKTPFQSAIALSTFLVSTVFILKTGLKFSLGNPLILVLSAISIVSFYLFVRFERNEATALIGFKIFRNRDFSVAISSQLVHFIALSGVLLLGPFYLERVQGLAPKDVGLLLIILPILMFIMSPLSGRLSDKIGSKWPTTFGMVAMTVGLFLFSQFSVETSTTFVVMSLIAIGIGVGSFSSPNSSALMGSVSEDQRAVTSSILGTNRNIGHAVGVAVSTAMFAFFGSNLAADIDPRQLFVESFRPTVYVSIGFALLGVIICLFRSGKKKADTGETETTKSTDIPSSVGNN